MKLLEKFKLFSGNIKNKLRKQEFALPDGTKAILKIRPKLHDKTKITIQVNKKIKDTDFDIIVESLPLQNFKEGLAYNPKEDSTFKLEIKATKKF